jgi:hypothetical protein
MGQPVHAEAFLCTSIPATLIGYRFLLAWKRQNMRQKTLPTVTCYPLGTGRDTDWFKTHVPGQTRERPRFIQSDDDLCRSTPA